MNNNVKSALIIGSCFIIGVCIMVYNSPFNSCVRSKTEQFKDSGVDNPSLDARNMCIYLTK